MKLRIAKGCIVIMPVIGILGLFIFTFIGEIMYGWGLFVIMLLLSGIFESDIFFRCPHCGKAIPANATLNQKYCPLCGEDLGLKDSPFSYYSKCSRKKEWHILCIYNRRISCVYCRYSHYTLYCCGAVGF